MSLNNTLASLALGVATEGGSNLLDNTFEAATSDLASSGHELARDVGHSLSQHLEQNPRHALEQNPPHTRFLAKAPLLPLAKPAQDLALAGTGSPWQVGAGDLMQVGLPDDLTLALMKHVSDWGPLRFYGEPLLLLALLGGAGLTGLGLSVATLKALAKQLSAKREPRRIEPSRDDLPPAAASPPRVETETPAHPMGALPDAAPAARGLAILGEETPPEDRPTEAGGTLDVDPPSRADPPTRVGATIDEVPVDGAPAVGAPSLPGEASGVATLPFGPIPPAPREDAVESDPLTEFALPTPDEDEDIEIDLSLSDSPLSLSDSPSLDVDVVDDGQSLDVTIAEEEAPDGLEVARAETIIPVEPQGNPNSIVVIEVPFSYNAGVRLDKEGEVLLPHDQEIANAFFSDAFGMRSQSPLADDGVAPPAPAPALPLRRVLAPAAAPEGIAPADDLAPTLDDATDEVAKAGGTNTDPGSQGQRDQLREEVVADAAASVADTSTPAAVEAPVPPRPRFRVAPPREPALPVHTRPPVITEKHRSRDHAPTPLPVELSLPVRVGPAPEERPTMPSVATPVPATIDPPSAWMDDASPVRLAPTPALVIPTPAPSYWKQGVTWLMTELRQAWDLVWNSGANLVAAVNRLGGPRVKMAEFSTDPLAYIGPVTGSRSTDSMLLRVPFEHQQIKDRMIIPGLNGTPSPVVIDLSSRPLQSFLTRIFPFNVFDNPFLAARTIRQRYVNIVDSENSFSRVPKADAKMDRNLDAMIIDGHLRNEEFAAVMMQLALECVGIYSEIVEGICNTPTATDVHTIFIAVYPNKNYRGRPITYIDVTHQKITSEIPKDSSPFDSDWLPRPSKRGGR